MPNSGFSWGVDLSKLADAVWTRTSRTLTNLDDIRAAKIDNLDATISSRATVDNVWSYSNRTLTGLVKALLAVPGDIVRANAPTERNTNSTSYVKLKEIRMDEPGKVRIKFQLKTNSTSYTAYAQIYRNGSPYGTERSTTSTSYQEYSEDLSFDADDLVQLYVRISGAATAFVTNFRIAYELNSGITIVPTVLID